nr:MAG TPA: Co-type nitrile hydratase alpha subunit [Caudoviricetes sp.]
MKEVIKKVIDFYKENAGTRWLIKDIIVSVLLLTIPTAATVVGLVLHLTWLIIIGAVLYFVSTLCLIMNVILCIYFAIETAKEADEILYGDDDEEDTTETEITFHVGDRVRAINDYPFYKRGMEGFVEEIDNSITSFPCIKVSLIDPLFGRLAPTWVNAEDFELSNHKEDA